MHTVPDHILAINPSHKHMNASTCTQHRPLHCLYRSYSPRRCHSGTPTSSRRKRMYMRDTRALSHSIEFIRATEFCANLEFIVSRFVLGSISAVLRQQSGSHVYQHSSRRCKDCSNTSMRPLLCSRENSTGHSPFSQSTGPIIPPLWHRMHVLCESPRRRSVSRSCWSTRSHVCAHFASSSMHAVHSPGSPPAPNHAAADERSRLL